MPHYPNPDRTAPLGSSQSVSRDQKSVNFSSVISLNQLLQHFKYVAEVYLTLINRVKILLSHNISTV